MTTTGTTSSKTDSLIHALSAYCPQRSFATGEVLRRNGQHYTKMYLITSGAVSVDLGLGEAPLTPDIGPRGLPIGEIGFLKGLPATADVTASTDVTALEITDAELTEIESRAPDLAVELLRFLATTADERTSQNLELSAALPGGKNAQSIRILLCRDAEMHNAAQRLRYAVYCTELGRQSPNADHERHIIKDDLDEFGHTFIAVEDGQTIGTLRANRPSEGTIGILERLYGMKKSPHNPDATVICTKFIIATNKRTSAAGIKLISAFARFGVQHNLHECYIDCIPSLRPFYTGIGFRKSADKFLHRENGPSIPMMLDLVKSRRRIERILATVS